MPGAQIRARVAAYLVRRCCGSAITDARSKTADVWTRRFGRLEKIAAEDGQTVMFVVFEMLNRLRDDFKVSLSKMPERLWGSIQCPSLADGVS